MPLKQNKKIGPNRDKGMWLANEKPAFLIQYDYKTIIIIVFIVIISNYFIS